MVGRKKKKKKAGVGGYGKGSVKEIDSGEYAVLTQMRKSQENKKYNPIKTCGNQG